MRTLGVDLASRADKTGWCMLAWNDRGAQIEGLGVGADDARLVELARGSDATGIDAPFGWPRAFVDLVAHGKTPIFWSPEQRDPLRFRRTDFAVRKAMGRWPLSVSSDLIAVPAMRCACLLSDLGVVDHDGVDGVYEVYPAAALSQWGFASTGLKGKNGAANRSALVARLHAQTPWLAWPAAQRQLCIDNDDALDALVCAMIARAARLGNTALPDAGDRGLARLEGWIQVPTGGLQNDVGAPPG